jgi:chromosome segregation ATPase
VATVTSVNALQASIAQAERQVQQDQSRVNQDASRLERSQGQLTKDKQTLADTQRQSTQAQQQQAPAAPAIQLTGALNNAIERPNRAEQALPANLTTPRPQLNSLGQTIGKLINVVA